MARNCKILLVIAGLLVAFTCVPAWSVPPIVTSDETTDQPVTALPPTTPPVREAPSGPAPGAYYDANGHLVRAPANTEAVTPYPGTAPPAGKKPAERNMTADIINLVLNLVLVLAIAYLVLWAIKRYYLSGGRLATSKLPAGLKGRVIRVVETHAIGHGQRLHLIVVADQCLLVAQTPWRLEILSTVPLDALSSEPGEEAASASGFADLLARFTPRPAAPTQADDPTEPTTRGAVPLSHYFQQRDDRSSRGGK